MVDTIDLKQCCLGIESGSTRIKAVLIGPDHIPLAQGEYAWENQYEHGIWTYHEDALWQGICQAYAGVKEQVQARYGQTIHRLGAMGVSAMMHGYLPLDRNGTPLVPFRTWRNTITAPAAAKLTQQFQFNIPQRWSIAHLYQAIMNGEAHVKDLACLTTLAGYLHYKLTGQNVLGIGDASGVFPIDSSRLDYDQHMIQCFDQLIADRGYPWNVRQVLPRVLPAGRPAGTLTEAGAALLDPEGDLESGIPFCPPEGDAGTGMVATNAVSERSGNVSAGTSVFAMIVLERPLKQVHPEIDLVTTPAGKPVAMVHCNNCTNEVNAWAQMLWEFLQAMGQKPDRNQLFTTMFQSALQGRPDGGGLVLYNYLSGEPITGFESGRPLLIRTPESRFTFADLMRAQLNSSLATLRLGLDILEQEHVAVDRLFGHGGFFKTPQVGQRLMAAAAGVPVSTMETAGEGGPWGMAVLAAYLVKHESGECLERYLDQRVFGNLAVTTVAPEAEDVEGFARFMERYRKAMKVERAALEAL